MIAFIAIGMLIILAAILCVTTLWDVYDDKRRQRMLMLMNRIEPAAPRQERPATETAPPQAAIAERATRTQFATAA